MKNLDDFLTEAILPGLELLGPPYQSPESAVFLLFAKVAETGLNVRTVVQKRAKDPALGPYQFNPGRAMVMDVLQRYPWAHPIVIRRGADPSDPESVRQACKTDYVLATVIARLGMLASKKPVPKIGDLPGTLALYLDAWKPGKERPKDYPPALQVAVDTWARRGIKPITKSRTMTLQLGQITTGGGALILGALSGLTEGLDSLHKLLLAIVLLMVLFAIATGWVKLDDRRKGISG